MATINYTLHRNVTGTGFVVVWASLSTVTGDGAGDRGQTFPSSVDYALGSMLFSEKSVQVLNARTVAGNDQQLLIEGSNELSQVDPTALTYSTLSDPQGNPLLFTQTGATIVPRIEAVLDNCTYIRPRVSTLSTTSSAMTVYLLLTSTRNDRSGM